MNLTLKNIPEPLYRRLKEVAARNRRSLNTRSSTGSSAPSEPSPSKRGACSREPGSCGSGPVSST